MEAMRRIFVILIVLILSLTASPIPVEGATSEVIITQEGRYQ